jgi:NADPH:quinone reductase-like Zn-dependent oxidoreductase
VHVVYDGVGKATFDKDLNVLRPRGYLVSVWRIEWRSAAV